MGMITETEMLTETYDLVQIENAMLACRCLDSARPTLMYNHRPDAVYVWRVECLACGLKTNYHKSAKAAVATWNSM